MSHPDGLWRPAGADPAEDLNDRGRAQAVAALRLAGRDLSEEVGDVHGRDRLHQQWCDRGDAVGSVRR
jgi:hypothetical protein